MKRTLLVLSLLALLVIVADALLTATVITPLDGGFYNFSLRFTVSLISRTADVLALATGVVALVAAAQRHQGGWFTGVFVLLLVSVYGLSVAYVTVPGVLTDRVLGFVPLFVFSGVLLAATPLATLVYSLAGAQAKPPATA
jgi:hypothetical protein